MPSEDQTDPPVPADGVEDLDDDAQADLLFNTLNGLDPDDVDLEQPDQTPAPIPADLEGV